jgi:hypothetical protein
VPAEQERLLKPRRSAAPTVHARDQRQLQA